MRFNAVTRRRESGFRAPAVVAFGLLPFLAASRAVAQGAQRIHDSTSADSIRFDQAPLPGGPAAVSRFLLSEVPQWIQIGGIIVGAIVGITAVTIAWKRRAEIIGWLTSRSRGTKMAMGGAVVLGLGMAGGAGMWSWNFMMHDNDFCSSCHVMKSAFGRFTKSEHDKLKCHDCHQQSIFASTKELYYWVLDRPEEIPKHAPVPNRICGECHEQKQADSTWKRVIATAGHSVHFKSDSAKLKDLMCVDCHAKQVHAFKAVDVTCGQEGCHDKIKVRLGEMANQSGLHCVTCHDFGRSVSERISVDSTKKSLVPAKQECFSCHEMRQKLEKRGLDKDPHKGTCGTCHNPHDQTKAGKAFETCANAGCHANADTLTAFHRGLGKHGLDDCGACHVPHSWKVESKSCITCHANIYKDDPRSRIRQRATDEAPAAGSAPAAPAPASFAHATEPGVRRGGPSPDGDDDLTATLAPPVVRPVVRTTAPADTTFLHSRHKSVKCESCHRTDQVHGQVTIKAPADCAACHHAKDARAGKCAACHATSELGKPYLVTTTMKITGRAAPISRALRYLHPQHEKVECAQCHAPGEPKQRVKTCAECHTDHHRSTATCTSCHEDSKAAHNREAHLGCASCHTPSFVATLPPSRTLCLSCHKAQLEHKPGQDCEACHRTGWVKAEGTP